MVRDLGQVLRVKSQVPEKAGHVEANGRESVLRKWKNVTPTAYASQFGRCEPHTKVVDLKNTLIIQFKVVSFDRLISIEDTLIQAFSQNRKAVVDGHDFGTPTSNIFIFPKRGWDESLQIVFAYLKLKDALDEVVIIKRFKNGTYEVVWPENFTGEFERL